MIEYRQAKKEELEECAKLLGDAHFPYEFSKMYGTENEARRYRFMEPFLLRSHFQIPTHRLRLPHDERLHLNGKSIGNRTFRKDVDPE